MTYHSAIQNIAIGIGSGIYSSIIVSVVFYILNKCQNEIRDAQKMIEPLYTIKFLIDMKQAKKIMNIEMSIDHFFQEANKKFEKFEPSNFEGNLKVALCNIYELLIDGKTHSEITNSNFDNLSKETCKNLLLIEEYENNFSKVFVKRIFTNKIIICMCLFFLALVLIA